MPKRSSKSVARGSYADLVFGKSLAETDEVAKRLADLEQTRQNNKLIMIASEALCPRPVREALMSSFTNLYGEGYPRSKMLSEERDNLTDLERQEILHRRFQDRRYYKGCDYLNMIESLAQMRICKLFATKDTPAERIYANVQPHSGATGNNVVYEAFLKPGDTVFGMDLSSGGHLTHGSKVNRSGKHYNIVSYTVDLETGALDYGNLRKMALEHKPRMIIGGYSAFPWDIDWRKLREIADEVGDCFVLADISHIAGLCATGMLTNPIDYAHVVMFTTQKTLCGPRGSVILTTERERARKIDFAVFPGEQSGAHFNNILAKAVCFDIALTEQYRQLMKQVVKNAQALAAELKRLGLKLAYGGTENHIVLVNLRPLTSGGFELNGEIVSRILDLCGITANKNTIAGDDNAQFPTGVRFGTTWITQRGLKEEHMRRLARIINSVITNIVPYAYLGGSKEVGRGKIPFEVMEKARKEVGALVAEMKHDTDGIDVDYPHFGTWLPRESRDSPFHETYERLGAKFMKRDGWNVPREVSGPRKELKAMTRGALVLDVTDIPCLEIYGEKSTAFLQEVLTSNIYPLQQLEGIRSLMLSPEGRVMAGVNVFRLEDTEEHGPRYALTSENGFPRRIKEWLGDLSDGYVRFDIDVFMKVEGPVFMEDKHMMREPWAAFDVAGRDARRVCEKIAGALPRKPQPWVKHFKTAGGEMRISKLSGEGKSERFRICGFGGAVVKTFEHVVAAKNSTVTAGGLLTRETLATRSGIPDGEKEVKGASLLRKHPELFAIRKPYFVGADYLGIKEEVRPFTVKQIESSGKKSLLYDMHRQLYPSASIHPFAGWDMPVVFSSIREEHQAVRGAAGLFDLSHMGVFRITGPYASRFIDLVASNYVRTLRPGHSHYSYLLDPNGNVIDDIFVYCLGKEDYVIVANAVNADKVWKWLNDVNAKRVPLSIGGRKLEVEGTASISDIKNPKAGKDRKMLLALQGPKSRAVLADAVGKEAARLANMRKFEIGEFTINGTKCFISRTGYTGEDVGYEIFVHPDKAASFWKLFLKIGEPMHVMPAGLGARDSTRTEAGFPLWGDELAGPDNVTPIEAGYGGFAKLHKPFFVGRDEMLRDYLNRRRDIIRFKIDRKGARIMRRGDIVATPEGVIIGKVTSNVVVGTVQIGLALVQRRQVKRGKPLTVCISHAMNQQEVDAMLKDGKLSPTAVIEPGLVLPRFPPRTEKETVWH